MPLQQSTINAIYLDIKNEISSLLQVSRPDGDEGEIHKQIAILNTICLNLKKFQALQEKA
jgi:hypothetical protein